MVLSMAVFVAASVAVDPATSTALHAATSERSVLELQPRRSASSARIGVGPRRGATATLINLNPDANRWFVLYVEGPTGPAEAYHLENPFPHAQTLRLDADGGAGLVLVRDDVATPCTLWSADGTGGIAAARKERRPYVPLCGERLYLRNPSVGQRTKREWAADVLRDRVRHGDQITNFIKEKFFRDRFLRTAKTQRDAGGVQADAAADKPAPILVRPEARETTLDARDLNLVVRREPRGGLVPGRWYALDGYPGVFASAVTPNLVAENVTGASAVPLDKVEASALTYLVAFDLAEFELGFALGTEHPRVGWSDRVPEASRVAGLPGPDGFDTIAPLARTGKLTPFDVDRVAATFSGGFKRSHGAFKWGALSTQNRGSHYGFVESGVVLSTLHPGLATLAIYDDGSVAMKTWGPADLRADRLLVHARQNGVALVEPDAHGVPRAGALVRDWGRGNWSGSQSQQQRTLRAGACLQEDGERTFLIYGYFTSVTPPAMARVFQACGCEYAMHLDMNAPEHTYLAVYRVVGSQFVVQRLVAEMAEVDPTVDGQEVPRYVAYSDNRDFFYLLRKPEEDSP